MQSYSMMMMYRMNQLCVKALPESLLPVQMEVSNSTLNLEDLSYVSQEGEYYFLVIPKEISYIPLLRLSILKVHPEFKVKLVKNPYLSDASEMKMSPHVLLIGMPDIDKDRKKLFLAASEVLYNDAVSNIRMEEVRVKNIISDNSDILTKETMDDFNHKVEEARDWNLNLVDQLYGEKKEEIERGYSLYQVEGPRDLDNAKIGPNKESPVSIEGKTNNRIEPKASDNDSVAYSMSLSN